MIKFIRSSKAFGLAIAGSALLLPLTLTAPSAIAATANGTLTVQATVAAQCSVNNPTLNFGAYNPASADAQSTTLSLKCTKSTAYSVALSGGGNGGGTAAAPTRAMSGTTTGNTDLLNYQLYTTGTYSSANVWATTCSGAPGATGTDCAYGTNNGTNPISITVYGQIPAGQYVTPDTYTDSVNITVTYN